MKRELRLLVIQNRTRDLDVPREARKLARWHERNFGVKLRVDLVKTDDSVRVHRLVKQDGGQPMWAMANELDFVKRYGDRYDAVAVAWDALEHPTLRCASVGYRIPGKYVITVSMDRARDLFRVASHELIHCYWGHLRELGYPTDDTMDVYDKEFQPNATDGNRARNVTALKPYLAALFAPETAAAPKPDPSLLSSLRAALEAAQAKLAGMASPPPPPGLPVPTGLAEIRATFGNASAPDFEAKNIATFDLPYPLRYLGRTVTRARCHRLLVPHLTWVLSELKRQKLDGFVVNYGGIYNNRPQVGSAKLSTHAWGIAIDVETEKYPLGSKERLPKAVVDVFARAGFQYGGDFARPDPMHFQYAKNY
jgi:hypothetical protein